MNKILSLALVALLCLQYTQGFQISLIVGNDASVSGASVSGVDMHPVTDQDRDAFGFSDDEIQNSLADQMDGRGPDDWALNDPTDNGNQYATYNWQPVQTILTAVSAQIVSQSSQPIQLKKVHLINDGPNPGNFHADMSHSVDNTVTSGWADTSTLGTSQTISYEVSFLGSGAGGSTTLSFDQSWQQSGSNSQKIHLGSDEGVSVTLQPGQEIDAVLSASQGTMNVEVTFQAQLGGDVYYHYDDGWEGHYYWATDVGSINSNVVTITETIQIQYYSEATVQLVNGGGSDSSDDNNTETDDTDNN